MSNDYLGLGDGDIDDIDRAKREELRRRNPNNRPEVRLEMWTLAQLTRNDKIVRTVVYGVVTDCLTDDYLPGEVVCSPALIQVIDRICVSQHLRYELKGPGNEITIDESDLQGRLPS
jgi:hypothetical protein